MNLIIAFLTILLSASSVSALGINPFDGPEPIAVMIQTNPWLMVIGSDTPTIAIYSDGQIIKLNQEKENAPLYVQAQLTEQQLEEVKRKILSFGDYSKINRSYDLAPNVADLPETKIFLNLRGAKLGTSIYGLMVPDARILALSSIPGQDKPDTLPENLKNLHNYLSNLKFESSKEWIPKFVEVMIWPYENAPDESIHWPKNWPGLDSPNTLKRHAGYSIFLPGDMIEQLGKFLITRKEKGAVEIGNKKWAVSLRYTFPGEPVWRKVFQSIEHNN
ncbi:MAG: hypothetical protein P8130_04175 [Deltaproteobacteria bacterium]